MIKTLRSVLRFGPVELNAAQRRLNSAASVADLRLIARRRLPRGVFDYIDGAAEDELTLRRNSEAFRRLEFRPRVMCDVGEIDTSTTLLGDRQPAPEQRRRGVDLPHIAHHPGPELQPPEGLGVPAQRQLVLGGACPAGSSTTST